MAIKLVEGFDVYPSVAGVLGVEGRWVVEGAANLSLVAGRFGGQGLRGAGAAGLVSVELKGGPTQEGAVGVAMQAQTNTSLSRVIVLADAANAPQVTLAIDALGRILAYRGTTSGAFLASTPVALSIGVWYYVEVEFRIDNPAGFVRVYVNGALLIDFTGNTQSVAGTATASRLGLLGGASTVIVDDVYAKDAAARLGESRIETLLVSADNSVAFVPNAGTENYSRVNEALVDGDTTYVYSSTVGAEDLYEVANMTSIPEQIHAVQTRIVAKKDDAATRAIKVALKPGTSPTEYGSDFYLSSSYTTHVDIYDQNPAIDAAWTKAAIDDLKIGQKITI